MLQQTYELFRKIKVSALEECCGLGKIFQFVLPVPMEEFFYFIYPMPKGNIVDSQKIVLSVFKLLFILYI